MWLDKFSRFRKPFAATKKKKLGANCGGPMPLESASGGPAGRR